MSADDTVARAAARILARKADPLWQPTDDQLDAWGRGYFAGHHQGYADAASQDYPQVRPQNECDWPPVTLPGTGGRS
jgi:hypothetical protein